MTRIIRLATPADVGALEDLIERSTRVLQVPFLSPEQLAASLEVMTLDMQLIDDGTYFVAEEDGIVVGCGGWTCRRGFVTGQRLTHPDGELLVPQRDPARVRAMYSHPDHARNGIGRLVLKACENAAREAGFTKGELLATLAGEPLYLAGGWRATARTVVATPSGVDVPAVRMTKQLLSDRYSTPHLPS